MGFSAFRACVVSYLNYFVVSLIDSIVQSVFSRLEVYMNKRCGTVVCSASANASLLCATKALVIRKDPQKKYIDHGTHERLAN